MDILYSYNIGETDLFLASFKDLYEKKRRDSVFAAAYSNNGKIIALRDHFGIIPLYYKKIKNKYHFSSQLSDLVEKKDIINLNGLLNFIGFHTAKISSLFNDIHIVNPGTVIEIDELTDVISVKYEYIMTPKQKGYSSSKEILKNFDFYFNRAIQNMLKSKEVGLYLSGGVDSSLIAYYLKKNGVNVNCYTSVFGKNDKHYEQSKDICKYLGIQNHKLDFIEYEKTEDLLKKTHLYNGNPGGTSASLNLISLWQNTDIKSEKQLFFGQNLDTLLMCMGNQYRTYFASFLPKFIARKVGFKYYDNIYYMDKESLSSNYLNYRSKGYVEFNEYLNNLELKRNYSKSERLILAGVYCGHTPADGEAFVMPSVNNNTLISNPYYDVDFAEYVIGIPMKYKLKLKISKSIFSKPIEALRTHKNLYMKFAETKFPKNIIYPKKSFMIPNFSLITDRIKKQLPVEFQGIKLNNIQSRIAVLTLLNFLNDRN